VYEENAGSLGQKLRNRVIKENTGKHSTVGQGRAKSSNFALVNFSTDTDQWNQLSSSSERRTVRNQSTLSLSLKKTKQISVNSHKIHAKNFCTHLNLSHMSLP
jgi:hypothetical protein